MRAGQWDRGLPGSRDPALQVSEPWTSLPVLWLHAHLFVQGSVRNGAVSTQKYTCSFSSMQRIAPLKRQGILQNGWTQAMQVTGCQALSQAGQEARQKEHI